MSHQESGLAEAVGGHASNSANILQEREAKRHLLVDPLEGIGKIERLQMRMADKHSYEILSEASEQVKLASQEPSGDANRVAVIKAQIALSLEWLEARESTIKASQDNILLARSGHKGH